MSGVVISNNYIHDIQSSTSSSVCGGGAGCVTGYIFLDPSGTGNLPNVQIYNNVLTSAAGFLGPANAFITVGFGVSGAKIFNNTIYGSGSQGVSAQLSPTFENNIVLGTTSNAIQMATNINSGSSSVVFDYNDYFNNQYWATSDTSNKISSFSGWQASGACVGSCDPHGLNSNPNLTTSYGLNAGSPVIGKGINLTSLGIGGLDQGAPQYFGVNYACGIGCVPRPSTGAWDIGAYQGSTSTTGGGQPPNPPSGLTALVQ